VSGFDNGTGQSGINFQVKQFGKILLGMGPPVPQAGVMGDLYIDTQQSFLYSKRSTEAGGGTDPWGHYLFQVPAPFNATLKWFAASPPTNDMGVTGDYCLLWAGFGDYGLQPLIYGPKTNSGWPENGEGPQTQIDPAFGGTLFPQSVAQIGQIGVADEGPNLFTSTSSQEIVTGVTVDDEFVFSIPVTYNGNDPVFAAGVQGLPAAVAVTLNPLYTAQDAHGV
jgi:hypothetical protein